MEEAVCNYPIAVAKKPGDKQYTGDNRTPTSWGSAAAIPSYYTGAAVGVPSAHVPFRNPSDGRERLVSIGLGLFIK